MLQTQESQQTQDIAYYPVDEARSFVQTALSAAGVREDVSELAANGVIQASVRGIDSHGIRLLPHYLAAVQAGRINRDPHYSFVRTCPSTGRFDADHTFGHAAGIEAMRKAMALAEEAGTGHVAVCNSTHCGTAAYFALEAASRGYIGLSFTHANALLNTPGSTRPFFGLNPICMAVPVEGEEPFCYDSVPARLTWNKLMQFRDGKMSIPADCGADSEGRPTTNPDEIVQLLPIGGYRGFGLAMMVDILCGVLTGMPTGRDITDMYKTPLSQRRYLGQYYIAIKIDAFQPLTHFKRAMKDLVERVRNEPRRDEQPPIMVPGDPEKSTAAARRKTGIPIPSQVSVALQDIARSYKIQSLQPVAR